MKLIAMVPVRKGSQRVKSKNTKDFGGTTLLDLKLEVLKTLHNLDGIYVSTDCEICMEIADKQGIPVMKRDPYYTSSDVSNDLFWKHLAEQTPGDAMMMSNVTSPLLKASTLQNAINKFKTDTSIDSIMSVSSEKKFLWQDGKSINYDSNHTPRSQTLPNIVSLNFAVSINRTENIINTRSLIGQRPYFPILDKIESIDIDDEEDFVIAELLYNKLGMDWILQ
jgi:CMP-N-acetylneuraminic acid synthetase